MLQAPSPPLQNEALQFWLLSTPLAYCLLAEAGRAPLRLHVLYGTACCASWALVRASPWLWEHLHAAGGWTRMAAPLLLLGAVALDAYASLGVWETAPSALGSFMYSAPLVCALAWITRAHVEVSSRPQEEQVWELPPMRMGSAHAQEKPESV